MSSRFYWPFDVPRQLNTHRQSSYSPGEVLPGLHHQGSRKVEDFVGKRSRNGVSEFSDESENE